MTAAPGAGEPGAWIVFTGADDTGPALARRLDGHGHAHVVTAGRRFQRDGQARWTVDPRRPGDFRRLFRDLAASEPLPLRGVVFLWATDAPAGSMSAAALARFEARCVRAALHVLQSMGEARAAGAGAGALWLVTRGACGPGPLAAAGGVPQALLWGLGRTAALELPRAWGGLVDLPAAPPGGAEADAAALADEILAPDGEDQVALRDGRRHVARLVGLDRLPSGGGATFRADATYLVTGGLGMLGLGTARWLVEREGVRSLVLVGRRPPGPAARRALERLRARGVRLRVLRADVAVEADVRRVFAALRRLPPLRGVFHGAGVLDDAVLSGMRWPQFTRVTRPKVIGAWLLHRHARAHPLDVFVLHSSVLSVTGSAGQANYTAANAFLDALAGHRRALGLPATVVNWGPWAEAGMARSTGARGEAMWKSRGVRFLPFAPAMDVLARALRSGTSHVVVTDTDWAVFRAQLPAPARLYADLPGAPGAAPAPLAAGGERTPARLGEVPAGQRRQFVLEMVRGHVERELGFDEPIDARQPLNELGLDSLMCVNVSNRLEAVLGVPVPVARLIRGPSTEELVDGLLAELAPIPAAATNGHAPAPRAVPTSQTEAGGWLVFPRPNPSARMRLVCFPWAGAGAAAYRPWAEVLHADIEILAVEPPGRGGRIHEPPLATPDDFFGALAAGLRPFLDRPTAFFGHCLGGFTAWELARRLRAGGWSDLRALFVSGVRPPHLLAAQGRFEETMLERMLRHDDFDPLRAMHEQPDEVFAEITRHFNIGATEEFLAQPELRRLLLPAVRADFAITSAYRFAPEPPWGVPITCFAGLEDPYVSREDAAAWSAYTRRAFRLHWREGAHFLVVEDRQFVVETLNRELVT
jgi:surfactin synthase thioesterase subunit